MTRRPSPFVKLIAAAALCASLSACAVYPPGGHGYGHRHGYGGGYRHAPSYAYAPPHHGGYGGRGGGWGGQRGWR